MLHASLLPFLIQGAPSHALIVHATVVVLPLAAFALLLSAFSSRIRHRLGLGLPLLGVAAAILVPLSTYTGGQLEHHVTDTPQVYAHVQAADGLLPWAAGLAVMSIVVYVLKRRSQRPVRSVGASTTARVTVWDWPAVSVLSIVVAVLATAVAAGTLVEVVYIGHLGAEAVWNGIGNQPYHSIPGGEPQ